MGYTIGKWTPATLNTLRFINEAERKNEKIKLKNFPSRTYINWLYPLKEAGYVKNGDGFSLTTEGKKLLEELEDNPPKDKRGRRRTMVSNRHKERTNNKNINKDQLYRVTVGGKELGVDVLLNEEQAHEVIGFLLKIKKEK